MISLFTFLFILGVLIIVHELGHFIAAKRVGVKVEVFSLGFGPKILSRKKNDTQYSLSAVPLGGYLKLAGDSQEEYKGSSNEYLAQTPAKRAAIVFCGPLLNYILGILCFWLIFFMGYPSLTTKVGGLIDGFGAQEAGVMAGDKIIAIDGKKVVFWEELQRIVQKKKVGTYIKLSILRDNKDCSIAVKIKGKSVDDAVGQKQDIGLLGITPQDEIINVRYGLFKSFSLSISRTKELTFLTYKSLWRMITGRMSMRDSVTGPLGIFYITSKAAKLGLNAVLNLVALLNISLAIFNLLPLPILDGGHILFLCVEKVRGKRISFKTERVITQIGMTLLISLALFVTYNDLVRFFGDKVFKLFK